MKIKSAYVNRELDFDVVEKLEPTSNQTMLLIKHDSLRDVIYNQLEKTVNVKYNYVKAELEHAVVECTIDDGEGRIVTEVGESVPSTLENDIARAYPALIASQRAFDRAAILLLKLPGKHLSNMEMGEFLPLDLEPAVYKNDVEIMPDVIDDGANDVPYMNAPIEADNGMMTIPDGIDDVVEEYPEDSSVSAEEIETRIAELGNTVFGTGKYNGKPDTIEQIYKNDTEYFRKLLSIPKPAESLVAILDLVREYVSLVER